jgi:adenylate cyclase
MAVEAVDAGDQRRRGFPGYKLIICSGLVITISLPLLALLLPTAWSYFNAKLYDEFLTRSSPVQTSERILIVDIDENSLREHGQWPWPRYKIAAILDRLNQAGAAAIGLDMMFPERDRTSLEIIRKDLRRDLNLSIEFSSSDLLLDHDLLLADAISKSPAVLGYQFLFDPTDFPDDCRLHPLDLTDAPVIPDSAGFAWNATHATCNLRVLSENAHHSGFFNVSPDGDGILRSVPLIMAYQDRLYPSLALAVVMKALKLDRIGLIRHFDDYALTLNRTVVPLSPRGALLVKYRGKGKTYMYISAADLLAGGIAAPQIEDKIVFVSATAAGLREFRATPTDPLFPGVEVHATVVDNLLTADFLSRPAWVPGIELVAALLCGLLYVFATARGGALRSLLLVMAGSAVLVWLSFGLFDSRGIYVSPLMALLVLGANLTLLNLLKFRREELKSRQQTRDLSLAQAAIIESMAALTETRDPETGGHIKRTQEYIRLLAEALREHPAYRPALTIQMVDLLYKSAPLHDIGKVGVPDRILLKPGKLTDKEFEEMKMHATIGRDVIAAIQQKLGPRAFLCVAHDLIYTHHEKWDGTGYPQGLKGVQIPLAGRLMAIADMYDALTSERVYKDLLAHEEAVKVMNENAAASFDPQIFNVFLDICEDFHQVARSLADPCAANKAARVQEARPGAGSEIPQQANQGADRQCEHPQEDKIN